MLQSFALLDTLKNITRMRALNASADIPYDEAFEECKLSLKNIYYINKTDEIQYFDIEKGRSICLVGNFAVAGLYKDHTFATGGFPHLYHDERNVSYWNFEYTNEVMNPLFVTADTSYFPVLERPDFSRLPIAKFTCKELKGKRNFACPIHAVALPISWFAETKYYKIGQKIIFNTKPTDSVNLKVVYNAKNMSAYTTAGVFVSSYKRDFRYNRTEETVLRTIPETQTNESTSGKLKESTTYIAAAFPNFGWTTYNFNQTVQIDFKKTEYVKVPFFFEENSWIVPIVGGVYNTTGISPNATGTNSTKPDDYDWWTNTTNSSATYSNTTHSNNTNALQIEPSKAGPLHKVNYYAIGFAVVSCLLAIAIVIICVLVFKKPKVANTEGMIDPLVS